MSRKLALVTGASSGLGKAAALALARMGWKVALLCRDRARGTAAMAEIRKESGNPDVSLAVVDLASLEEVRAFARTFGTEHGELHVLLNNAGVYHLRRKETGDGFEETFAVNHLAPFLLTNLLRSILVKGNGRVVNVSSDLHREGHLDLDDLFMTKRWEGHQAYARSKLANVLFTYALARRLSGSGVKVNAYTPGLVATEIARDMPEDYRARFAAIGKSPEDAAAPLFDLVTSPARAGVSGAHFALERRADSSPDSYDAELQERLWRASAELTGLADPSVH